MPTFKTETLCIFSNVQLVKRLFTAKIKGNTALLHILLFFNSNSRCTLLLRPCPSVISIGKCHIKRLKSSKICFLIVIQASYHATSYLCPQGRTHTHKHTHTRIHPHTRNQASITRQMLTASWGKPENPPACLIALKVMTAI